MKLKNINAEEIGKLMDAVIMAAIRDGVIAVACWQPTPEYANLVSGVDARCKIDESGEIIPDSDLPSGWRYLGDNGRFAQIINRRLNEVLRQRDAILARQKS